MMLYRHVDYYRLHPDIQKALTELDSALRRNSSWSGAQITFDLEQFDAPPIVDVLT